MGLLIVNTYLYSKDDPYFVNTLRYSAEKHYRIDCESITDIRVHRKILLSLTLCALLSEKISDAKKYLVMMGEYIKGPEILRYNKFCDMAKCPQYKKRAPSLNGKNTTYYGSEKIVPWIISLCH